MEMTHTHFTKVTRVELIHEDSVMVLSTGITTSTGMLSVLSDTSVTAGNVSSLLSGFVCSGRHDEYYDIKGVGEIMKGE